MMRKRRVCEAKCDFSADITLIVLPHEVGGQSGEIICYLHGRLRVVINIAGIRQFGLRARCLSINLADVEAMMMGAGRWHYALLGRVVRALRRFGQGKIR